MAKKYELKKPKSSLLNAPGYKAVASPRQKKLLKFLNIPFSEAITGGAAGWEIAQAFHDAKNQELWKRYLYLTKDFDVVSSELMPHTKAELQALEIPEDWSLKDEEQSFVDEIVKGEMSDASPFDLPQPIVQFSDKTFVFTGSFDFGTRTKCREAVISRGGISAAKEAISERTDYLVIGTKGSPSWKRGAYGKKIEKAILKRRSNGRLSIISEDHWVKFLEK